MARKIENEIEEVKHKPGNRRRRHLIAKRKNPQEFKALSDKTIHELDEGSNLLEALPQEIVVNILTKLKHSDLKHILLVSKFIYEAALIARKTHFLFSTPSTKPVFSRRIELSGSKVPRAPKALRQMRAAQQSAKRSLCNGRQLSSIFLLL